MNSLENQTEPLDDRSREFLFTEHKALRDEILALEERGMRIQIAGLTGIPTLIAAGSVLRLPFLIIFSPVIILVASLMTIFTQDSIMRDGRYIKECIEPHLLRGSGKGWEHFLQEKSDNRKVEHHTRVSIVLAFAFYYIGATILACSQLSQIFHYVHLSRPEHDLLVAAAATVYGLAFVLVFRFIFTHFPSGTDSAQTTSSTRP